MMMIALMIAAALAQAAGPEQCNAAVQPAGGRPGCPHWRFVGRNDRAEVFVDPASVRPDGNSFRVNLRIVYYQDLPDGNRSGISRMRFDCARRMDAGERLTMFDADGRQSADVTLTGPDAELHEVVPGQPAAALLDEFCPGA